MEFHLRYGKIRESGNQTAQSGRIESSSSVRPVANYFWTIYAILFLTKTTIFKNINFDNFKFAILSAGGAHEPGRHFQEHAVNFKRHSFRRGLWIYGCTFAAIQNCELPFVMSQLLLWRYSRVNKCEDRDLRLRIPVVPMTKMLSFSFLTILTIITINNCNDCPCQML